MSELVLAGLVVSGAWTQLDEVGLAAWLTLAAVLLIEWRDRTDPAALARHSGWKRALPVGWPQPTLPLLVSAALCLLHLAHTLLTIREEFGFGGDEGYHLSAVRAFVLYHASAGPYLVAALGVFVVFKMRRWPCAATATTAALFAASRALPPSGLFARYPTGFYLLASPLNGAFEILGFPYPFSANHIVNALSLPAWLFLLRPWLLGRWPDWPALPVAMLLYFQGAALTYVSSGYLEPWAIVFLLLALEAAIVLPRDQRWIAVALVSVATFFKETFVLFVPTLWFLTMVEWDRWRPRPRPGALAVGAASIMPFAVHYSVRRSLQIFRGFEVADAEGFWSSARVVEWITNARTLVGTTGLVVPCALALLTLALALHPRAKADTRRLAAAWLVTAAALSVFFHAERLSVPYTGHARFLIFPLLALCGVLFAVAHDWNRDRRRAAAAALVAIIAVLQAYSFARTLALDFGPDHGRNSLEWRQALIRLPIRSLASRLEDAAGAGQVRRIRVVTSGVDLTSLQVAYPDLAARYELVRGDQAEPDCTCRTPDEAVLAGFNWPANFDSTADARRAFETTSASCTASLRRSCGSTLLEQRPGGAVVGALGVGLR